MVGRTRAALAVSFALSGCAIPATPTADVESVRLTGLGAFEQRMTVTLCVTNPNPDPLVFRRVTVDLDVAGSPLASGSSETPVRLPAQSSTRVPFTVRTTVRNLSGQLVAIATEGQARYRVHGSVALAGMWGLNVPYSRAGIFNPVNAIGLASSVADGSSSRCAASDLAVGF